MLVTSYKLAPAGAMAGLSLANAGMRQMMNKGSNFGPPDQATMEEWVNRYGFQGFDKPAKIGAKDISDDGIEFLIKFEGLRLKEYKDQAGYPTIGIGHRILHGEKFPDEITKDQAIELKRRDLQIAIGRINKYIYRPLDQHEFDMVVSFVFNNGLSLQKTKSFINMVNDSFTPATRVREVFEMYNIAGGKVSKGLTNRRKAEAEIYINGYNAQ